MKGKPASLITLFCTGAVTIASKRFCIQASSARSNNFTTYPALSEFKTPALTGCLKGTDSSFKRANTSELIPLGIANKLSSPSRVILTFSCSAKKAKAALKETSGPIPAGSPVVITRLTGAICDIVCVKNLHSSTITQFTNPVLIGLLILSLANRCACKLSLLFNCQLTFSTIHHLD